MYKKSAISLISYDASYLPDSIRSYYNYVDEIVLGLDKDRISWNNKEFTFDEAALWSSLLSIDVDNKITVVEENFHQSAIAIENDNHERNFLKDQCSNDWIISIDADEVLINSKDFFNKYCPIAGRYRHKIDLCMTWITPYKQIDDTILLIANEDNSPFMGENQGIMTSKDSTYTYARWTDKSAQGHNRLLAPLTAIHWSLCRTSEELSQKINNTGHADLAGKDPFYNIWSKVTLDNYSELKNFKTSGLGSAQWPKLFAVPANELTDYCSQFVGKD
jgi:hypothetical protein